jgi:hypothetical protein
VRLASGRIGTLVSVNFTRAIVELEGGDDRQQDLPGERGGSTSSCHAAEDGP